MIKKDYIKLNNFLINTLKIQLMNKMIVIDINIQVV